jgi:hypothetical protein
VKPRHRKGNHPANPYAAEAAILPRLEDRPGYPFAMRKADLSDEAQLGQPPPPPQAPAASPEGAEPTFVLRASDRLSGMLVRCWAGLTADFGLAPAPVIDEARRIASAMDAWRQKNSGGG